MTDLKKKTSPDDTFVSSVEKPKKQYQKNFVPDVSLNALFKKALDKSILTIDDVMNSSEEVIMKTILDSIHPYAIKQLADGRYFTYIADPYKPEGRRQIKRKSKSQLFKFLVAHYGVEDNSSRKTFAGLYAEWVNYKKNFINARNTKKGLSASTICRYEQDYNNYICGSPLDKMKLDKITPIKIEEFFMEAIDLHQISDRCACNMFGYLNQAFDFAVRSSYLSSNPMRYVDKQLLLSRCPPPAVTVSDEDRILTKVQMAALEAEIHRLQQNNPTYMPNYAIELAMYTGMRLGELAALKWSCIDDLYIHIDFSEHRLDYYQKKSEIIIGEPKNRKHRAIPLTSETRKIFEKIRANSNWEENEFVFTNPDGTRCTARSIGCAVIKKARKIGIEHVSIHRIRRTVSSMLNETLPQKDVAELLGHSEKVNEMHYHYATTDFQEKMTALNRLSSQISEGKIIKIG